MEGFIAVCATAKRWEALVPNKRANNGLAGDTYANEGVPRESILGCAHNRRPMLIDGASVRVLETSGCGSCYHTNS